MDCATCQALLHDEILAGVRLDHDTAVTLASHLGGCADCRVYRSDLQDLRVSLPTLDRLAECLPSPVVASLHARIMAAVRADAAAKGEPTLAADRGLRVASAVRGGASRSRPLFLLAACAALVVAGIGLWWRYSGGPAKTDIAARPRSSSPTARASASGAEVGRTVPATPLTAADCRRLEETIAGGMPELEAELAARRELAAGWRMLGDAAASRRAFLGYLEAVEKGRSSAAAARCLLAQTEQLAGGNQGAEEIVRICDELLATRPASHLRVPATFLRGVALRQLGKRSEALAAFRLAGAGTDHWAMKAKRETVASLMNAGAKAEALAELKALAAQAADPDDSVYAQLALGMYYYGCGAGGGELARGCFAIVVRDFPQHQGATRARQMLARLEVKPPPSVPRTGRAVEMPP